MPEPADPSLPARRRPRWWTELLLIAVVYAAYSGGRLLARGDVSTAVDHGLAILDLEKLLFLNAEHPLNRLFTEEPWIGIPADFAYASLHYLVTPAVLVWLYLRRPAAYLGARTWLMLSTLLGLVGFTLMPTCPPRLLDPVHGFTDTMAQYSSYGWWGGEASAPRGLGGLTNQYAAMPSLHVGWALWCGVLLWRHGRHPLLRAAGIVYPVLTVLVVLGTANHYLLDAVAGAAVMGIGYLAAPRAVRLAGALAARIGGRPTAPTAPAAASGTGPAPTTGAAAAPAAPASPHAAATAREGGRAPAVSGGWETSARERLPAQRTTADDDTPAAAR
ncbi:phosphatase PAP2 family protein [Streptomyces sp. NPDC097619]|uniref:phosphatase PAP2 family protein n=1 Tax=Streptomyces sp. NPDC097619 TaxID=3157228 RepID=UPI003316B12F